MQYLFGSARAEPFYSLAITLGDTVCMLLVIAVLAVIGEMLGWWDDWL